MVTERKLALLVAKLIVFKYLAFMINAEFNEPVCTSRYDYEYKVMKQLITLEAEMDKNKEMIKSFKTELDECNESNKQQEKNLRDVMSKLDRIGKDHLTGTPGATYTRWGKTSCPGNGSELVYKGFAAGSHYSDKGGASTYLCLPEDPTWNVFDDTEQDAGNVWGAEYEFLYRNQDKFFGKNLAQKDVPCSVCYTRRSTVQMIPGRNICYPGWTLEYHGYLMTGHHSHHATDYVCLDEQPEEMVGGAGNENGKLFYFAEARCNPLRCPPYVQGRELTCAVCSR